jgi:hypothetical protein
MSLHSKLVDTSGGTGANAQRSAHCLLAKNGALFHDPHEPMFIGLTFTDLANPNALLRVVSLKKKTWR